MKDLQFKHLHLLQLLNSMINNKLNSIILYLVAIFFPFVLQSEWSTATTLSNGSYNFSPSIAINPDGDAIAIWISGNAPNSYVQASRYQNENWTIPYSIAGPSTYANPVIELDHLGNGVAAWQARGAQSIEIQAVTMNSIGEWTIPQTISNSLINGAPALEVDLTTGKALIIWSDLVLNQISSSTLELGGNWSFPIKISGNIGLCVYPSLAMNPLGQATAIWQNLSDENIYSASYFDDIWLNERQVSKGESNINPQIVISDLHNSTAIWQKLNDGKLLANYSSPTGIWEENPTTINDTELRIYSPSIAIDGMGNTFIGWINANGEVKARTCLSGLNCSYIAETISGTGLADSLRIAMDSSGSAVALWTNKKTLESSFMISQVWSSGPSLTGPSLTGPSLTGASQIDIGETPLNILNPTVRVNSSGGVIAAWVNQNPSGTKVQCSTNTLPSSVPSNLMLNAMKNQNQELICKENQELICKEKIFSK